MRKIFGLVLMKEKESLERDKLFHEEGLGLSEWLKAKNLELDAKVAQLEQEPTKLKAEIEQWKSKIREQTEADLLLVSLKIIIKSLYQKSELPEIPYLAQQQKAYQAQLAGLSQHQGTLGLGAMPAQSGFGILHGLGLGNMF
jgi:hypothetical protein